MLGQPGVTLSARTVSRMYHDSNSMIFCTIIVIILVYSIDVFLFKKVIIVHLTND
jgi:hypothetical protein